MAARGGRDDGEDPHGSGGRTRPSLRECPDGGSIAREVKAGSQSCKPCPAAVGCHELMTAAQGLEYRHPLKAATEIERARQLVRTLVPRLEEDRVIAGDIERLAKGIRDGDFDSWSA